MSTRRIQNHSGAPAGHGGAPKVHAEECAALGGVEGGQLGGNSGGSKGDGSDGEEAGGEGEGEGNRGGGGSAGGADGSDPMFAIGTARASTGTFANTARRLSYRALWFSCCSFVS